MQELQDQRRNFVELIGEIGHFRRQMTAECHHGDPFFFLLSDRAIRSPPKLTKWIKSRANSTWRPLLMMSETSEPSDGNHEDTLDGDDTE